MSLYSWFTYIIYIYMVNSHNFVSLPQGTFFGEMTNIHDIIWHVDSERHSIHLRGITILGYVWSTIDQCLVHLLLTKFNQHVKRKVVVIHLDMELSWNKGTPNGLFIDGFSIINHPAIEVPPWLRKPPYVRTTFLAASHSSIGSWEESTWWPELPSMDSPCSVWIVLC